MSIPFHRRKFRSIISTSHTGGLIVEQLEHWLADIAGVSILSDAHSFSVASIEADKLESMVALCQSMIIFLARQTIESGWAKRQFEVGLKQQKVDRGAFRIIPIRVDGCDIPEYFQNSRWIDISEKGFNADSAAKILLSLYSNDLGITSGKFHDVYLIRSWGGGDELGNLICSDAKRFGFRLILSPEDKQADKDLSRNIIAGCGGGIMVISASSTEKLVQKISDELEILDNFNLPYITISDHSVIIPSSVTQGALAHLIIDKKTSTHEAMFSNKLHSLLVRLQEEWVTPPVTPYVFYGTDLKDNHKNRNQLIRQIIQQTTSMPCLMGEDIQQGQIQTEIINRVVHAQMMIADISKENLNTCIEAGIAIGANVSVNLVSGDERHKPPFMFRDRQIWHYQNELDLLGIIHKLVLPYRRLII